MTSEQIEALLIQVMEAVALCCDETSELVDKYHRPFASESGQDAIQKRSLALSVAAESLRQALPSNAQTTHRQSNEFQRGVK